MRHFDVVDLGDTGFKPIHDKLVALGRTTVIGYYPMSNGAAKMANDVLRQAGPGGAGVVRIWGHGVPGVVAVSAGDDWYNIRNHHSGFGVVKEYETGTMFNNLSDIAPLATAMGPKSRLELRGCSVVSGPYGVMFGKALAKMLKCWVYASSEFSFVERLEWVPPIHAFPPGGATMMENVGPPPLLW